MALRAVIFDIGGVLELTPSTGWRERWAADLGLTLVEMERRLDPVWQAGSTGAITLAQVKQRTATILGLDDARCQALMNDWWVEYVGTLNADLARYFAGLRPRYRTGILSNSFVGAREREQAAYDLAGMCDVVVYSHEEGWMKPDPRFYRVVCRRLGVRPDEALFLDDVQANLEGARAVGMTSVTFVDNRQAVLEVERHLAREAT